MTFKGLGKVFGDFGAKLRFSINRNFFFGKPTRQVVANINSNLLSKNELDLFSLARVFVFLVCFLTQEYRG